MDVRGRDVGSYVGDAKRLLEQRLTHPPGCRLEWSVQYEAMECAGARVRVVVPVTLAIISCSSSCSSGAWPRARW